MTNDYYDIAYLIKILCYKGKFKEAKKIYEDCVRCKKLPQLYFDKSRYTSTSMPKWMCVIWDEEIIDPNKVNCLITITLHYIEFMQEF